MKSLSVLPVVACGASDQGSETVSRSEFPVLTVGGDTTVESGTPSTRAGSCPDGSMPDQCGSWDGVELFASLSGSTASNDERCLCRPIDFELPAALTLTAGNAGKHRATLSFRKPNGAVTECRYKGDRIGGHSGGAIGGWQYVFEQCSDGSRAKAALQADWFKLAVSSTDKHSGPTEVRLRLGEPDVVDGVVQESVFYSDDPRVPEAALHVPRGAAPDFQDFSLSVLEQVVPGSMLENGGSPVESAGHALDVKATGVEDFVFTPVPGASCPRIELPYDPALVPAGSEDSLQARQILDIAALLAGQSTLAPVGDVTVDPLRHVVSFCVEHLSFYAPTRNSVWNAQLLSATLTEEFGTRTVTKLLYYTDPPANTIKAGGPLPVLQPSQPYTLALEFKNLGSTIWRAAGGSFTTNLVWLSSVTRSGGTVVQAASPFFGDTTLNTSVASDVVTNGTTTFSINLQTQKTGLLNLCLYHDISAPGSNFFGECFSWDHYTNPDAASGTTNAQVVEACDGVDNDGNEGNNEGFYRDADRDGFGSNVIASAADCASGAYVTNDTSDCDDGNAATHPGATEICNHVDNNCTAGTSDEPKLTFYRDSDGDTYGNAAGGMQQDCSAPSGYATSNDDCNDGNSAIHPNAADVCDGVDSNCDGKQETISTYYPDCDQDTFGRNESCLAVPVVTGCELPPPVLADQAGTTVSVPYVTNSSDCDNNNQSINPNATEVCDFVDNNCANGTSDEPRISYSYDRDQDGWCTSQTVSGCPGIAPDAGMIPSSTCESFIAPPTVATIDCNDANSMA
ncbi:MAG TPA: putative metal-binding motif-containing protein, partial [Polyangiaceae bacterium]|nr:putative metal-binding motif-containing protein [Polyangiaceae bacterium]